MGDLGGGGETKDVIDVEAVVVAPDRRARHGAGAAAGGFAARDGGGGGGVVVLERHAELRATGAALTVFPNGWFALRASASRTSSPLATNPTKRTYTQARALESIDRHDGKQKKKEKESNRIAAAADADERAQIRGDQPRVRSDAGVSVWWAQEQV